MSVSRFDPKDAAEVRKMREETGQGMMTCKIIIQRQKVLASIQNIRDGNAEPDELPDVLEWLVRHIRIG